MPIKEFVYQAGSNAATNRSGINTVLSSVKTYLVDNPTHYTRLRIVPTTLSGVIPFDTSTAALNIQNLSGVTSQGGVLEVTTDGYILDMVNTANAGTGRWINFLGLNELIYKNIRMDYRVNQRSYAQGTVTAKNSVTYLGVPYTDIVITPDPRVTVVDPTFLTAVLSVIKVDLTNKKLLSGGTEFFPASGDLQPFRIDGSNYVLPMKGSIPSSISVGDQIVVRGQIQGRQPLWSRQVDRVMLENVHVRDHSGTVQTLEAGRELFIDRCSVGNQEPAAFFCTGADVYRMLAPRSRSGAPCRVTILNSQVNGIAGDDFINVNQYMYKVTARGASTVTLRPHQSTGVFGGLSYIDIVPESTRLYSYDSDGVLEHAIIDVDYTGITYTENPTGTLDVEVASPAGVKDYVSFIQPDSLIVRVDNCLVTTRARSMLCSYAGHVDYRMSTNQFEDLGGPAIYFGGDLRFFPEGTPMGGKCFAQDNLFYRCNLSTTEQGGVINSELLDDAGTEIKTGAVAIQYTIQRNRFVDCERYLMDVQDASSVKFCGNTVIRQEYDAVRVGTDVNLSSITTDRAVVVDDGNFESDPLSGLAARTLYNQCSGVPSKVIPGEVPYWREASSEDRAPNREPSPAQIAKVREIYARSQGRNL